MTLSFSFLICEMDKLTLILESCDQEVSKFRHVNGLEHNPLGSGVFYYFKNLLLLTPFPPQPPTLNTYI